MSARAPLQIPTITEEDLKRFHRQHFLRISDEHAWPKAPHHEEEVDNGLGYYPDGTERTLTDEQVAMFRHSEIQQLLRQKRRAEAAAEEEQAEKDNRPETPAQQNHGVTARGTSKLVPEFQTKRKHGTEKGARKNRHQGKRPKYAQMQREDESVTHRRYAREQDEAGHSSLDLDYGDSEDWQPREAESQADRNGRKLAIYDDDYAGNKSSTSDESAKAAKQFLWPKIEAV